MSDLFSDNQCRQGTILESLFCSSSGWERRSGCGRAFSPRFRYLKPALAIVLIFIGSKIFLADLLGLEKFPAALSLSIAFAIIAAGAVWSLLKKRDPQQPA